jgi:GAF domain-containing protein
VTTRRELRIDDLAELVAALRSADRAESIFRAVDTLSAAVIGHRLFTIMRFDAERAEVERVHSSMPAVYPVGGRKAKRDTAWSDHTLRDMKVFRASGPEAIGAAFDDHATILSLGLGAVLNIPLVLGGRCIGTMNLLHAADWYGPQDEPTGLLLGAFLLPVLRDARPPSPAGPLQGEVQRPIA